eukprot:TRINITY_DN31796_c0_g1_i1.p1 TRINITY_DN31796_c0_g1~~TRINITY_DN31796_c0_g1_i1.p1  ORF type:complete len:513 (-),score=71.89 TRINITY_DN31796_c0_g1_i1:14-1441(-)
MVAVDSDDDMDDGTVLKRDDKEFVPFWKLCLVALPQLGVQVMWQFLGPNSAPFMKHLGARDSLATLNNVAGPLVGFFTGPLIGAWSDRSTNRFGRRRPIILGGLVSTLAAGTLWSGSQYLLPMEQAIYLSAPMFWVLDLTVNILQTPFRALVADMASPEQQAPLQVVFIVIQAAGNFFAYWLLGRYDNPLEHMFELMGLVLLVNVICVAVQMLVAKEVPFKPDDTDDAKRSCCGPILESFSSSKEMPAAFWYLAAIQCLVFFGIQTWNGYSQQWFTHSVHDGDGSAAQGTAGAIQYKLGKDEYALGGEIRSVVQLVLALFLMAVISFTSIRPGFLYAPCLYASAVASLLAATLVGQNGAFAIGCLVLSIAGETGSGAIPYGVVARWNQQAEDEGRATSTAMMMALLNCCITVGQQATTLTLAGIQTSLPLAKSLLIILGISGIVYAIAGTMALFLKAGGVPGERDTSSESDESSS